MLNRAGYALRCAAYHCLQRYDRSDRSGYSDIRRSNARKVYTARVARRQIHDHRKPEKHRDRAAGVRRQISELRNRGLRKQHRTSTLVESMKSQLSNGKTASIPIEGVDGSGNERRSHRNSRSSSSAHAHVRNAHEIDAWCKTPNAAQSRQWFAVCFSPDSGATVPTPRGGVPTPSRPPFRRRGLRHERWDADDERHR